MTDADAKKKCLELLSTQTGGMYLALSVAVTKFDKCELYKNWIEQLCATISQNNCNVDDIVGLATKAIQ